MQIISGLTDFQLNSPSAIAIGKFDGIHLGHRLLIDKIKEASRTRFCKSVIFTFNPSPESFFNARAMKELTTVSEKRRMFEELGIDILIEFPINKETAATDPLLFIEKYLHEQMRAVYIAAGSDLSFGDKGKGDSTLLLSNSKRLGYECEIIDKVTFEGEEISSTRIREAVAAGKMELATSLLGCAYRISGTVGHGRHLGTRMGMPTANVYITPDKAVGPNGVYYSRVRTTRGIFDSITNVGVKPTVAQDELLCAENYIYDFNEDIYGEFIEVELLKFCRPEMKFSGIEELKARIASDIAAGREYHNDKKQNI